VSKIGNLDEKQMRAIICHLFPISFRGRHDASSTHHRFTDECCNLHKPPDSLLVIQNSKLNKTETARSYWKRAYGKYLSQAKIFCSQGAIIVKNHSNYLLSSLSKLQFIYTLIMPLKCNTLIKKSWCNFILSVVSKVHSSTSYIGFWCLFAVTNKIKVNIQAVGKNYYVPFRGPPLE